MITIRGWGVKNVKSFQGTDGLCFSASLYRDNKRVGFVKNDGRGGPNYYEIPVVDEKALRETAFSWMKDTPGWWQEYLEKDSAHLEAEDIFVEELLYQHKLLSHAKSQLSKKLIVADGPTFLSWKLGKYDVNEMKQKVRERYPDGVILNDLPIDEAAQYWAEESIS